MYGIIYCAINKANGKIYIGKTTLTLKQRKIKHKSSAKKSNNTLFLQEITRYGWDSFSWKVLDHSTTKDNLSLLEKEYIDLFSTAIPELGYNATLGGDDGFPNVNTWNKMCLSQSNRSKETCKNISEGKLGIKNGMYGIKGILNSKSREVVCIETNKIYSSISEAEEENNISHGKISMVCSGKRHTAGKFHWKYF
jgi:group I intron endonuclease